MTYKANYPFRIFVSYAHADKLLAEQIVDKLTSMEFLPLWDKDINPGKPFTQEIKDLITRAHLFMPIITPHSNRRPWVHQETGFAIALNIPVLPICIEQMPSEMIAEVQAITVKEDLSDFASQLTEINLMQLVVPKPNKPYGMVEVAETTEERTGKLAQYAAWVIDMGVFEIVRIQSRLTSFCIPDVDVDDPRWDHREGDLKRSPYMRQLQREERRSLERHARMAGCRLIVDPTAILHKQQGEKAQKTRLKELLDFLKSMPHDKLAVVMSPRAQDTNLTIVGDYIAVESMAWRPGQGYLHSVFNAHPPTVLQRIQRFDQLFNELQLQNPRSIEEVIQHIEALLNHNSKDD